MNIYCFTTNQLGKLLSEALRMYEEELKRNDKQYNRLSRPHAHVQETSRTHAIQEMMDGLDAEQELDFVANPNQIILQEKAKRVIEKYAEMKGVNA